jgi:hypothetical protein
MQIYFVSPNPTSPKTRKPMPFNLGFSLSPCPSDGVFGIVRTRKAESTLTLPYSLKNETF